MEKRFKEMLVKQDITTLLYKKRGWSVINYSVVVMCPSTSVNHDYRYHYSGTGNVGFC